MIQAKERALSDHRDSPRYAVALSVRGAQGDYRDHYGTLGINGFYFETTEIPMLGQRINVRLALVGLGVEVETTGTVTAVQPSSGHVGVVARFDEIEFESERFIARWLDLMYMAYQRVSG